MSARVQQKPPVDMEAVMRISRRVRLMSIQLSRLDAWCDLSAPEAGIEPLLEHDHGHSRLDAPTRFQVLSKYGFTGRLGEREALSIRAEYLLSYELTDGEPASDFDLGEFAKVNGSYHSWPFIRALLHDLTGRMGLPPYTMPVLILFPKRPVAKKEASADAGAEQGK